MASLITNPDAELVIDGPGDAAFVLEASNGAMLQIEAGHDATLILTGEGSGGGGGGDATFADPVVPVLAVVEGDATPKLSVQVASLRGGDVLRFEFTRSVFTAIEYTSSITVPNDMPTLQALFNGMLASLVDGTWKARVWHERAGFAPAGPSNTVTWTVGAVSGSAVTGLTWTTSADPNDRTPSFAVTYTGAVAGTSPIKLRFGSTAAMLDAIEIPQVADVVNGTEAFTAATTWAAQTWHVQANIDGGVWYPAVPLQITLTRPTLTALNWDTPANDFSPSFTASYTSGIDGMTVKLRYATAAAMTGATILTNVANPAGTSSSFTITPDLAVGTYYAQAEVNGDGIWYPQTPLAFTLANTATITGVLLGVELPVVNQTPQFNMDVQPNMLVGDTARLRISATNPPTAGELLDQTVPITNGMLTNAEAIFSNIPVLANGTYYAQLHWTRGAGPVASNVVSFVVGAASTTLLARTTVIADGDFLASGTQNFANFAIPNTHASRKLLGLALVRGDNSIRPVNTQIVGAPRASVAEFIQAFPGYNLKLFLFADASSTVAAFSTEYQNGGGTTEACFMSFASLAQLENAGALGTFAAANLIGESTKQLAAQNIPAGGMGYAVCMYNSSTAPSWSDGVVDDAQAFGGMYCSIVKKDNTAGATPLAFQPTVTLSAAQSGVLAVFTIAKA
jgi:hypothetical protein